jgi:hypothetical protein
MVFSPMQKRRRKPLTNTGWQNMVFAAAILARHLTARWLEKDDGRQRSECVRSRSRMAKMLQGEEVSIA